MHRVKAHNRSASVALCLLACCTLAMAQPERKIIAPDGAPGDFFADTLDLHGELAIIGAPYYDTDGYANCGAAYIVRIHEYGWSAVAFLIASDPQTQAEYGQSVGLSDRVAIVGAPQDDNENGQNAGAAYILRFNGSDWAEEQKLLASDGAALDEFGARVAIYDDIAVVGSARHDGATGAVYVFEFNGSDWVQKQKLMAGDGEPGDGCGSSVALVRDRIVVGAAYDDGHGSAYVFRFNGVSWIEETKLSHPEGEPGDEFGTTVAISGHVVVVSCHLDDDNGSNSGSAFVFRYDGAGWQHETKLLASNGDAGDWFGNSVAISDSVIAVGASYAECGGGTEGGAVYVFRFVDGEWTERCILTASDASHLDRLGIWVALDGGLLAAGAHWDDNGNGTDAGAAYVFGFAGFKGCPGDVNGDGMVDVLDLLLLLAAWGGC